ncbi:MAG: dihydrolipoyl dehydrogenase [Pseudomonadota bacterium]
MSTSYDLVVIGSGPAGYVAAIHGAQSGLKTALIEKKDWLGGTCLNVGCIPTKAMLHSAAMFDKAAKLASYGVKIAGADQPGGITLDFPQVNKRKDEIVKHVNGGVAFLMKKNKVDVIRGMGRLAGAGQVEVTAADGSKSKISAKNIILATGSKVRELPHIKIDGKDILSSDHILYIDKVPESLAILGGGVVGSEFASCFGRFGSKVAIFEMSEQLVPSEDFETAAELAKALKKQNVEIFTSVKVKSITAKGGKVEVQVEGEAAPRVYQKALISVGRAPVTEDIGLETVGIKPDARGFIPVDLKTYKTTAANVYAVGDIIPTPQLAHTASAEAMFAVDIISGKKRSPINYLTNPGAIYTYPEVASIGHREQDLKKEGREYSVGKFPFSAIAKARIEDASEGFVKIITDKKYGEILGVHIVHAKATELIAEFSLGNNLEMTIDELAHTIHPHPTISETILEAAHAAKGHAIHI